MPGKALGVALVFSALLAVAMPGYGLTGYGAPAALPAAAPGVPRPVSEARDVTMAQLIAGEPDRAFDYSFSFRFVKKGETAYYVRYNALYLCDSAKSRLLLDNALIYWMYIDGRRDLWFCVGGSADISGGQMVERESLYHYDRAGDRFRLVLKESNSCTFSNRFYRSYFLYVERGYLKAYDTSDGSVTTIDRTDTPAVFVPSGQDALYYTDRLGRQIMLTGLDEKGSRKTKLKSSDFPLGEYAFDDYIIDNGQPAMALYKFCGAGYARICEFEPPPDIARDPDTMLCASEEGIYAIPDPSRAAVDFYSFSTRAWSRVGDGDATEQYGFAGGRCWFYTCSQPVTLCVIDGGKAARFSFGGQVEGCSSIRVMNDRAYIFQYDGDWLAYALDLDSLELYRITD